MFLSHCKDNPFFSPLTHFENVCMRAIQAIPGLKRPFVTFFVHTLLMCAVLPRRVNFTQLQIFGKYSEKTYRQHFSKRFEWVDFNLSVSDRLFEEGSRKAIAIDPSYISKSGNHTPGIGTFWSGVAQQAKHGLEILGMGLIDIDAKDCCMIKAEQTPSPKSLSDCGLTLSQWYLSAILSHKEQFLRKTRYVVADAYFATHDFAHGIMGGEFHLVSRFRCDAALMYLHEGEQTKKKGRPRIYDGKIDFRNLDMAKMEKVDIFPDEGQFYTLIAYSKSLKAKVRLVIFQPHSGKHYLYFSTDTSMSGKDVVEYYRTRFQIEFCFRDGKQFTGLCDCQARDFDKQDFAFNASLSAINVAKVVIKESHPGLSIGRLKTLFYNCYMMKRFFDVSGIRPNRAKNKRITQELWQLAAPTP